MEEAVSDSATQRITISQRSRPLRFGYLLRGFDDRRGLRAGIRLFTSLWGGMYNCFIPVYRRRPSWWPGRQPGPAITRGYLDAFEPDFLVAEDPALSESLDYDQDRILVTTDLIRQKHLTPFSHGIGVHELLDWMYDRDFQYVKRTLPQPTGRGFETLIATCFGEYLGGDDRSPDFESEYKRVFAAEDLRVTPETFMQLHNESIGYPLVAGRAHLEVPNRDGPMGPLVFFLDPSATRDLVDYWNLRAYGMNAIVVPLPWFAEMESYVRRLVQAAHRPHPMNPKVNALDHCPIWPVSRSEGAGAPLVQVES